MVFHEIKGVGGADAVWTSKVLDAGLRAHLRPAHVARDGRGRALDAHGQHGDVPDRDLERVEHELTAPGDVSSPAARFVQVRARFANDPNAVLSQVELPFVTDNLRAVVTRIDAQPKNAPRPRGQGQRQGRLPTSGAEPPTQTSVLKVTWKVDNPDADTLRYRLAYRLAGQTVWRDITRPDETVTKSEYEWETAALPEGQYRVRVEASDENANPPDRTARHALDPRW